MSIFWAYLREVCLSWLEYQQKQKCEIRSTKGPTTKVEK